MNTILALLLGSAIVGFLIGLRYRVGVIAFAAPIIAVAAAITVRHSHFVLAVAVVFASLLVSQLAYLIGIWLGNRSTSEQSNDRNGDDC